MTEQDFYEIAGEILDDSIKLEPLAARIAQRLLAIQQEPRVMRLPSDEEIEEQSNLKFESTDIKRAVWKGGAKWMRDQVRQSV